jgi:hypothetical protein
MNAEHLAMICKKESQTTCGHFSRTLKIRIQKETKENFINCCPLQYYVDVIAESEC